MAARLAERQEVKAYRSYVTDSLQAIAENTARMNGGQIIKKRFADILYKEQDTRTSSEIISALKSKLKKVGEHNGIQPT